MRVYLTWLGGAVAELRRLHARKDLEARGEVVGSLEVEAVGYFLDALASGGE